MVDGLFRLRHQAILLRNYEDDDVRDVRAACPHLGEGRVAGGIYECYLAELGLDGIRTDVLCNAALFASHDICGADIIQKRRLAVIDVAHNRNDGRPRNIAGLGMLFLLFLRLFNRPFCGLSLFFGYGLLAFFLGFRRL